ncbi:MAG TPA: cytochrome P450 [Candidatus Binataceae bacterium]|nr:cytochrome P450 [Candidatus Binataceae bacterium]
MSETNKSVYFNPWDPAFRTNPYPSYEPLLAGSPQFFELFGRVLLTARFDDVTTILKDYEHFRATRPPMPASFRDQGPFKGATVMLFADPPVHTRLRGLVSRDFTPRRIREMEPRIRAIADQLMEGVARKGELDVMSDVADVLPVMVIAEMLGVPPELYPQFKQWSDTVVAGGNTFPGMPVPPDFKKATDELRAYLAAQIEMRRSKPGSDLISALVAAHADGEALTEAELLAFVVLLLLAGNETTTNLIGNGMLALGRNPDQMDLVRRNPELTPRAIEEILRYDGPVQATVRFAAQGAEVGGVQVPPGTGCFAILAAANRDPSRWENPGRFDVTREPKDHVAFGDGIHFCIGAPLARLEGTIAIGSMLKRFPKLRLKDPGLEPKHKGSYFLRGLESLPMAFD